MHSGSPDDVRRRNLIKLLSEACNVYVDEVLNHHKLYIRFADDFINLHRHTNCQCALGKNIHSTNWHIVKGILTTRQDLVERYFTGQPVSNAQLISILEEYDTTLLPQQHHVISSEQFIYTPPTFGCYFGKSEISLITYCVIGAFLFSGTVSETEIESLFSCTLKTPLKVSNNRQVAIFFDELSRKNLICREWQLVIDRHGLLLSSNGTKLTSNKLSSALSQSQNNDIKYRPRFAEMAKELQRISTTDKNAIK